LGVSRSIVAGRIDRARKAGDPRFAPRPPRPRAEPPKVRIIKPAGEAVGNVRTLYPAPELSSRPRLLINLKSTDCRWPTGAAADGRHLFCGQPQAPGRPYCERDCGAVRDACSSASAFSLSPS